MRTENTPPNAGENDVKEAGPTPAETAAPVVPAAGAGAVAETPKRIGTLTALMALEEPARTEALEKAVTAGLTVYLRSTTGSEVRWRYGDHVLVVPETPKPFAAAHAIHLLFYASSKIEEVEGEQMAIDATIAGAASNSYLSLAEAQAYFAARLRSEAWETASDADKEKTLLTACRRIEAHRLRVHRRPYGYPYDLPNALDRTADPLAPADPNQALSFPRQRDLDRSGSYAVPEHVKQAQCEEALTLLAQGAEHERRRALQAAGVKSFTVDGLSESYESGAASQMLLSAEARSLLAPFIERGGVIATSDSPDGEWSPGSAR